MGTVKDSNIKKNAYCDEVLTDLAYMIQNVNDLRDMLSATYEPGSKLFQEHDRHLVDLAEYLDWKLQILTTSCPFEWKGMGESVEHTVSVREPVLGAKDYSGGYLGG
jgi:hypothetical protein